MTIGSHPIPTLEDYHGCRRDADLMLREANHRIANSLQAVMASSLAATARHSGDSMSIRRQLTTRITAVAELHRLLSTPHDMSLVPFGTYLDNLVERLNILWGGSSTTRISAHHSGEMVAAEAAVKLGMVVNELVTNSCKYACDGIRPVVIRVGFSVSDGSFKLVVADNGRGRSENATNTGLGTRLIEEISESLEAKFGYCPGRPGTIAVMEGPAEMLLCARRRINGVGAG